MFFNLALYTGLFLASEVLAAPSGLGARLARRREGRQSQLNQLLESDASASSNVLYSSNWAGAMWAEDAGTFTTVTGTFTVPTPSGSTGTSASAWVGIDGYTCESGAILQTGVDFTVGSDGQVIYDAWYEWLPANAYDFSGITISAGDVIKLTVAADSTTSGTATVENLTNGQTVSIYLTSFTPLCEENAEWIVEDYKVDGVLVPFADFGTVTFTDAFAGTYTPTGATIVDIEQHGEVLTAVVTAGSSVAITYI